MENRPTENKNIYESAVSTHEEEQRLKEFGYPTVVSTKILSKDVIRGKTIMDIGSGPNTDLGKWVAKQGGEHFIAFDIQKRSIDTQHTAGSLAVQGDTRQMPFIEGGADITHERFMLMHLSREERKKAIGQILSIAGERSVFVEYDWNSFEGSPLVNRFRDFALRFLETHGADPFLGATLRMEVEEELGDITSTETEVIERRFQEGPIQTYGELIALMSAIRSTITHLANISAGDRSEEMEKEIADANEILELLSTEASREDSEPFSRPDIVTVEVVYDKK